MKTVGTKCLDHFVVFGERYLRHLLREFIRHDNAERYHHGLGGRLVTPPPPASNDNAGSSAIRRKSWLGPLLDEYSRVAA